MKIFKDMMPPYLKVLNTYELKKSCAPSTKSISVHIKENIIRYLLGMTTLT